MERKVNPLYFERWPYGKNQRVIMLEQRDIPRLPS